MDGFIRTLNVSAKDKEEVKNLGAKWSKKERSWYVPEDVYSGLFCKWIPFNWNFERALNLDPIWGGQIDQLGACYAIQNYGLNLDQKEQALIHEDGHIRASAVSLGGLSSAELERALIDPHWHVRFAAVVISDSLNELQFERALTDCEDPIREHAISKGNLTAEQFQRALTDDSDWARVIAVELGGLSQAQLIRVLQDECDDVVDAAKKYTN